MSRGKTYITSTMRWTAAGCPTRTDDEVDQLFREHCHSCQWYGDSICTHPSCGCRAVSSKAEPLTILGKLLGGSMVNKLRRETEHCPIGKW